MDAAYRLVFRSVLAKTAAPERLYLFSLLGVHDLEIGYVVQKDRIPRGYTLKLVMVDEPVQTACPAGEAHRKLYRRVRKHRGHGSSEGP